MSEIRWVEIKRFVDLPTAQLVAAKLNSEGILTQIPDLQTQSTLSHIGPALGGVRLLVRSDEHQRAIDILTDLENHKNGHDREVTGNLITGVFGNRLPSRQKVRWAAVILAMVLVLFLIIQLIARTE